MEGLDPLFQPTGARDDPGRSRRRMEALRQARWSPALVLAGPMASRWQERHHGDGEIFARMVTRDIVNAAIRILAEGARPTRIVLFGSYARGHAGEDSDLDFL